MSTKQYQFHSKAGPLYLVASDKGLCGVFWKKQKAVMAQSPDENKFLVMALKQLEEYFDGDRKTFEIETDIQGTAFQKLVWQELSKIPYGQTVTYQEIARRLQNEKAVRAVGTANGRNPLSLIVPCHRVIRVGGDLGGYAGGLATKKFLLSLERALPQ